MCPCWLKEQTVRAICPLSFQLCNLINNNPLKVHTLSPAKMSSFWFVPSVANDLSGKKIPASRQRPQIIDGSRPDLYSHVGR